MKQVPCKHCGELLEFDDWFYLVYDEDSQERVAKICKICHDSQYGKSKEEQEEDDEFWNGIFEAKMSNENEPNCKMEEK